MTTEVEIVNRALQSLGTQTTVASLSEQSNEAIQANIILTKVRDDLLRMAPWNCATIFNNLTYITSSPGTPENQTSGTTLWARGQPAPPWIYEYQYPVDCLKPLFIVPQFQTGFAGGIPITTAVTGGGVSNWQGPPVKFKVALDEFVAVIDSVVAAGGTGYGIGDVITLSTTPVGSAPIGAPPKLLVATVAAGVVLTTTVVSQINGSVPPIGGSYFNIVPSPNAQSSTTGNGTGATFNLVYGAARDQRVILTNQEFANLAYCRQVTDPNVMDPLFQDAWVAILAARLAMALTGDKGLANLKIQESNNYIIEARKADGNEGLTINDVTPDWIRIRGVNFEAYNTPYNAVDWGGLWMPF